MSRVIHATRSSTTSAPPALFGLATLETVPWSISPTLLPSTAPTPPTTATKPFLITSSRPSSHYRNCSYSPHFCPLPRCHHIVAASDIARHLGDHHRVPVNFYRCKDTVRVRFSNTNMDPLLALQLDDSMLCLLRNRAMPSGRAMSIVCRQPLRRHRGTILRKNFLYKIVAKNERGTELLLDNAVMKFCKEDYSDVFLYLPKKFYCDDAELQLEVCIWEV